MPLAATITRTPPQPADDAPHLLLVDDDRRIRDLLSRFLAGEGFRVTTAVSASEGRLRESMCKACSKGMPALSRADSCRVICATSRVRTRGDVFHHRR